MTRWIHGISRDLLRSAFGEYFSVSDEHVDVLVALYSRPGEWTTLRRLQVLIDSHRPPKRQTVYERIRVLREAMDPESLLSGGQLNDQGYALSEVGFAECANALRSLANALLRAGPQITIPPADSQDGSPITTVFGDELTQAVAALEAERPGAPEVPEAGDGRGYRKPLRTGDKLAS